MRPLFALALLAAAASASQPVDANGNPIVKRYKPRFSDSSDFAPGESSYDNKLLSYAIAGIVLAVLTFVTCFFWIVWRLCCYKCCCRESHMNTPEAHKGKIFWAHRIAFVILSCFVIGFLSQGLSGNTSTSSGVSTLFSATDNTINFLQYDVNNATTQLKIIGLYDNSVATLSKQLDKIEKQVNSVHNQVDKYNNIRESTLLVAFILPLIGLVFGWIALGIRKGSVAYGMVVLFFISTVIAWIVFGLHAPLAHFTDGACLTMNGPLFDGQDITTTPLAGILPCFDSPQLQGALDSVTPDVDALLQNELSCCVSGVNVTGLQLDSTTVLSVLGDLTQQLDGISTNDQTLLDAVARARAFVILGELLVELATCQFAYSYLARIQYAVCTQLMNGFFNTENGAESLGITMAFMLPVAVSAIKLFSKPTPAATTDVPMA